jgi:hypothetical protein
MDLTSVGAMNWGICGLRQDALMAQAIWKIQIRLGGGGKSAKLEP